MNSDRYQESADMRLLALERARLGMSPPREGDWQRLPEDEKDLQIIERPAPATSGQKLAWSLDATPSDDLVTGAVVTLTLSVVNDGTAPIKDARVMLPLSPALRYRAGTLTIDGRRAEENLVDALLGAEGAGLVLPKLAPGMRTTILARFVMGGGTDDVAVTATVEAPGLAVSGGRAVRLRRGTAASAFAALLPQRAETPREAPPPEPAPPADERPFYELDSEEELVFEAADAALSPAVQKSVELPPEPAAPSDEPEPQFTPAPRFAEYMRTLAIPEAEPPEIATGPEPAVPVEPAESVEPAEPEIQLERAGEALPAGDALAEELAPPALRALGGPVFRVTLDEARLRTLASLFSGTRPLGMLAHYLVLNALAAVEPVGTDSPDRSLAQFAGEQERLLTRALVSVRMQREVDLEAVTTALPPFPPTAPNLDGPVALDDVSVPFTLTLYRAFRPGELRAVGRTIEGGHVAPFLRNALLIAGCCSTGVARPESPTVRATEQELAEYGSAAAGEVNRLFVRARLTRKTEFFTQPAPSLDDRARALISAMQRTLDT